jgi:hypothetical protein
VCVGFAKCMHLGYCCISTNIMEILSDQSLTFCFKPFVCNCIDFITIFVVLVNFNDPRGQSRVFRS